MKMEDCIEIKYLVRKIERIQGKIDDLEAAHKGNEQKYTYWGAWEMGHNKGELKVLEENLDEIVDNVNKKDLEQLDNRYTEFLKVFMK